MTNPSLRPFFGCNSNLRFLEKAVGKNWAQSLINKTDSYLARAFIKINEPHRKKEKK